MTIQNGRRYFYGFLAAIIGAAVMLYATSAGSVPPMMATSVVKVLRDGGHGSGVNIGGGYIVSAAHVVGDSKSLLIKSSDGKRRYAKVLWFSKEYDIALLRTGGAGIAESHLACRGVRVGDSIRAEGNPAELEFVSSYGKISGDAREAGPWKSVYVTDMSVVMGMSGGPVFDKNGDVIGITIGIQTIPLGEGQTPSLTGFGMVVPSSVVCDLMGLEGVI